MKPAAKHRILIADDHPLVREWLAHLINQQADLIVCGQAADAPETLQAIHSLHPDMAIVDLSMDGNRGTDLVRDIRTRDETLPVLVLSMHDESLYAERALRAGARGYISKREGGENVKKAIRCVLDGGIYVGEKIAGKLLSQTASRRAARSASVLGLFSDRELEVFQLLGCGHGPSQIASELHLSVRTVEGYMERIKQKLGLSDARELHQRAIEYAKLEDTVPSAPSVHPPPPPRRPRPGSGPQA
jgi:DNA-binding NarL/FixJ family response regulator